MNKNLESILSTTSATSSAIYHLRLDTSDLCQMLQIAELSPLLQRNWIHAAEEYGFSPEDVDKMYRQCPYINRVAKMIRTHEDTLHINLGNVPEDTSMLLFGSPKPPSNYNGLWSIGDGGRDGIVSMTAKDGNTKAVIRMGTLRILYKEGFARWID